MRKLLNQLSRTDDFVIVHSNELQAILDYVQAMEHRISIVRKQLQYLLEESVEDVAELGCPPCNQDCNQGRDCPSRKV
jgi:hypothetical protein